MARVLKHQAEAASQTTLLRTAPRIGSPMFVASMPGDCMATATDTAPVARLSGCGDRR